MGGRAYWYRVLRARGLTALRAWTGADYLSRLRYVGEADIVWTVGQLRHTAHVALWPGTAG